MDAGLVPMFHTPVPVDFHVLRLLTANLIFESKAKAPKRPSESISIGRKISCSRGRSPSGTAGRIGSLRSRSVIRFGFCHARFVGTIRAIPVTFSTAKGGRRRKASGRAWGISSNFVSTPIPLLLRSRAGKGTWGSSGKKDELLKPSKIRRFGESCAICPVRGFCTYNISSGAYYIGGKILPERLRFEPPNHQRDLFGHQAFDGTDKALIDQTVRFAKIKLEP